MDLEPRILLVDTDRGFLRQLAATLRRSTDRFDCASSVRELVSLLGRKRVAAIVLGLHADQFPLTWIDALRRGTPQNVRLVTYSDSEVPPPGSVTAHFKLPFESRAFFDCLHALAHTLEAGSRPSP